jgi:hypothetical protein
MLVVHAHNHGYLGDWDLEDCVQGQAGPILPQIYETPPSQGEKLVCGSTCVVACVCHSSWLGA